MVTMGRVNRVGGMAMVQTGLASVRTPGKDHPAGVNSNQTPKAPRQASDLHQLNHLLKKR